METTTQLENPWEDFFNGLDYLLGDTPEEIELRKKEIREKREKEELNIALKKAILDEMNEILQSEEFSTEEKLAAIDKAKKEIEEKVDLYCSDSMLAFRNEYLRVKDNDGFYSESIKKLFEEGEFLLKLDYYSAVKDELTKVLDFLNKERIRVNASFVGLDCSEIDFDCSEIIIFIDDDNFYFAHTPYRLESMKDFFRIS